MYLCPIKMIILSHSISNMKIEKCFSIDDVRVHRSAIMGIAMLSIMLFHQEFLSVPPFNAFHYCGYWGVEIFLFLSGMGMVNSLNSHSTREFYKRRFIRLFPACFLFGSIKILFYYATSPAFYELYDVMHLGMLSFFSLDLWFINVIIIYYAISPALYYCLKRWSGIMVGVVFLLCVLSHLFVDPIAESDWYSPWGIVNWTLRRLPVFSIGMYVGIYPQILSRKTTLVCSCLAFIAAVVMVLISKIPSLFNFWGFLRNLFIAVGTAFMVYICIFMLEKLNKTAYRLLTSFGIVSLELYLIHEFVFRTINLELNGSVNNLILLSLAFAISLIVAFLGKWLLSKLA